MAGKVGSFHGVMFAARWLPAFLALLIIAYPGTARSQTISTVAGRDVGDGAAASAAVLNGPKGVAIDSAGNVYIADTDHQRIRRVASGTGVITTIAGNGLYTHSGDGGAATNAGVSDPYGIAVDSAGNVYFTTDSRVRKVNAATGVVTTIAGGASSGFSGDGGLATLASLNYPQAVALDSAGNLYIADTGNNRIRKVAAATGLMTTVAGNGSATYAGDGGFATSASLNQPKGVAVDALGNLLIADQYNHRIRRVSAGVITTVAGSGVYGFSGDGGSATSASLAFPSSVAVDSTGTYYLLDNDGGRIRRVTGGIITTVAGTGTWSYSGDGGTATSATFNGDTGLALDSAGNLYLADTFNHRVRRIASGVITTFAGSGVVQGVPATNAGLYLPRGITLDSARNLYFADTNSGRVRKVAAATGLVTTIAGKDGCCVVGDNGPATSAYLSSPAAVAVDALNNVYIAESSGHRVRKVAAATGIITTVAGTGTSGYLGDAGAATSARLSSPSGIALDATGGNLYIADYGNHRVRRVALATGIITTVAGTGTGSFTGDGGAATAASLNYPTSVAVDGSGNLYVADYYNNRVRRVAAASGIITTVAGNGECCFDGDFGLATSAAVSSRGIAVDAVGNLFIADYTSRVRRVSATTGYVTTVAGGGVQGFTGDGGPATNAALLAPRDVALDSAGNLYIADTYNNRIRKVTPDAVAPGTAITSSPTVTSTSSPAAFAFAGTDPGAGATGFQCSLDGAAFLPCTATFTYSGLAPGTHTLVVRAIDGWGNVDPTPATVTWKVTRSALSTGKFYECALDESGGVYCWGDSGSGKLGTGEPIYSAVPVSVGGLAQSLTAIDASQNHTCALSSTGDVLCWGGNYFGELGQEGGTSSASPLRIEGLPASAVALTVGVRHNCALTSTGSVHCWGSNSSGQLGNGLTEHHRAAPVAVQGLTAGVAAIGGGSYHTCARTTAGAAYCWGSNGTGQLGNGTTTGSSVPVAVLGLPAGVASIAGGLGHTCALTSAGALYCWGDNADGQLGNGTRTSSLAPVRVPITGAVRAFATGDYYTCAITDAGALLCWGGNYFNALGTGAVVNTVTTIPTAVVGMAAGVTAISAGRTHACSIKSGVAYCWGYNAYGGLGDGTTIDKPTPVQVGGLPTGLTAVSAGNFHSCAIGSNRRAHCWGYYGEGQLGGGAKLGRSTPVPVSGLSSGAVDVRTGHYHSCALNASRGVLCWGKNSNRQLGNNSQVNSSTPVAVQGLAAGVSALAVGGLHTCAVNSAGAVMCWGDNYYGQLGDGTDIDRAAPTAVLGLPRGVVALTAGQWHTCALTNQGAVHCWGYNSQGGLGDGTTYFSSVPVKVANLPADVVGLSGNLYHSCAVTGSGAIWCWGNNLNGQLGDGTTTTRTRPVQVQGLPSAMVSVSAGFYHSCARAVSGGVHCWGYNGSGELGDGTQTQRTRPVAVIGLPSGGSTVAAGERTSCTVTDDGAVLCWGYNNLGQMGDGTYVPRNRPVTVLAALGGGNIDANNWYLDLDSTKAKVIATELTPKVLAVSQLEQAGDGLKFDTMVKYKTSEYGRAVGHFVFALVPPQFFSKVKRAPGAATEAEIRAKSGGSLVFAQLTPAGWTNARGQLYAYTQGVASAAGGANNILDGIDTTNLAGARFCIGYGASATDMLGSDAFREVLVLEGATATVDGTACVLSGVYVDGPSTSRQGTPVTFSVAVVGVRPAGTIQFKDYPANLGGTVDLSASNEAVATASLATSSLAAGVHSIGASYGGDALNSGSDTEIPLRHVVSPVASGTSVALEGASSSVLNESVTLRATVTGSSPSGTVQFKAGAANLGSPAPVLNAMAMLTVSTLPAGSHTLTASYLGDDANAPSTSNTLNHTVYAATATSITLTSSATEAMQPGTAVTFTARVTGANPTGSVAFRDGATLLTTVTLAGGTATYTIATLEAGQHVITAEYSGDASNQRVTSAAVFHLVSGPDSIVLTVTRDGTGTGTVTSSPAGIDCGSTCSRGFAPGTSVTLTASPTTGAVFAGWGGACTGSGACSVTMNAARAVTATFNLGTPSTIVLTVAKSGAGSGSVTSSPGGIDCGTTCSASFIAASPVTLTAIPDPGSVFSGWSEGGCSGTAVCTLTLTAATTVNATFTPVTSASRLANLSTRGSVQTGDNVMIGGFVVGGSAAKKVLIRARGPSLAAFGVQGAISDTVLQLYSGQTVIANNDNWQSAANAAEVVASGLAPTNGLESTILTTLSPGAYTAIVSGSGGKTGVGIVEVFEVDRPDIPLTNLSTRGLVQTGDNVMIGGFIIQGAAPMTVLIRANGPSLTAFGVAGAMADPRITLYSGQTEIASNNDWGSASNATAIAATGLAPTNARESAIFMTLTPGAYTVVVSGANGGTGVGIIEVFAR